MRNGLLARARAHYLSAEMYMRRGDTSRAIAHAKRAEHYAFGAAAVSRKCYVCRSRRDKDGILPAWKGCACRKEAADQSYAHARCMAKFARHSGLPEAWQTCGVCKAQIGAEFAVSIAQRVYAKTKSATSAAMLAEALVRKAGHPVRIAKLIDKIMDDEASVGEQRLTRLRLAMFEYLISAGYLHASHDALRDYMGVRWYSGVSRTHKDPVRRMELSASGLVEYVIGTRDDGPDARTALRSSEHSLRIALDLAKERRRDGTYNSSQDERVLLRRRLARTLCAQPSRAEEGVRILKRVCKAEQTRLGHDHPRTREVMAELARACASPPLRACTSPVAEDEEDDEFVHTSDPRLKPSLGEMMRLYSEIKVDVDGSGRLFSRDRDSPEDARLYRAMRNDPNARLADFSY